MPLPKHLWGTPQNKCTYLAFFLVNDPVTGGNVVIAKVWHKVKIMMGDRVFARLKLVQRQIITEMLLALMVLHAHTVELFKLTVPRVLP